MYKQNEYNKKYVCPVCGNLIFIDSVGNGEKCQHCGWEHSRLHEEFPDRVMCPNLISLNKIRQRSYIKKVSPLPQILTTLLLDMIFMEKWNLLIKV